jgi:hypothetical protein
LERDVALVKELVELGFGDLHGAVVDRVPHQGRVPRLVEELHLSHPIPSLGLASLLRIYEHMFAIATRLVAD